MPFYLLAASLLCPTPIKEDKWNRPWTDNDQWMLEQAINGCRERFNGRSPCLKKLVKLEAFQDYYAVCGDALKGEQK